MTTTSPPWSRCFGRFGERSMICRHLLAQHRRQLHERWAHMAGLRREARGARHELSGADAGGPQAQGPHRGSVARRVRASSRRLVSALRHRLEQAQRHARERQGSPLALPRVRLPVLQSLRYDYDYAALRGRCSTGAGCAGAARSGTSTQNLVLRPISRRSPASLCVPRLSQGVGLGGLSLIRSSAREPSVRSLRQRAATSLEWSSIQSMRLSRNPGWTGSRRASCRWGRPRKSPRRMNLARRLRELSDLQLALGPAVKIKLK